MTASDFQTLAPQPAGTRRTGYTALIRTRNSAGTLPKTIESLKAQSVPPSAYVFVDSGSTDETLACVPEGSVVHRYVGRSFNYSEALNQGLDHVRTEHVLIISSHTSLGNTGALAFALGVMAGEDNIGAAYFCNESSERLEHSLIDSSNFDGFNGLWNTCALIRTALVNKRRFRPEVFSAEDQEWASWLLHSEGRCVARISGAGFQYGNPNKGSRRKLLDEYAAVALFANRRLLEWPHLAEIAYNVVRPMRRPGLRQRYLNLALFLRLLACRFAGPEAASNKPRTSPGA